MNFEIEFDQPAVDGETAEEPWERRIEGPSAVNASESPTTMDFSLTLVETLGLNGVLDGSKRSEK